MRRDKREEPDIKRFAQYTGCPLNEYRKERGVRVDPGKLTSSWRQAVCAAEALSVVVRVRQADDVGVQAEDRVAQRLRLEATPLICIADAGSAAVARPCRGASVSRVRNLGM